MCFLCGINTALCGIYNVNTNGREALREGRKTAETELLI